MDRMDFAVDGPDGYGFDGSNCHPYAILWLNLGK